MVEIKKVVKPSFSVIGREGSTDDGNGFIERLWADANARYGEVQALAKTDENGQPVGFWGAMSNMERTFAPWENFSRGLYLAGVEVRDDAEAPEAGRVLVVTPAIYAIMKKCKDIVMETAIGNDLRLSGVIGILDGMSVQKIPAVRLPEKFGFMVAHPCATVAPVKLEDYTIHDNPPGISGSLVEGRISYDAFVLDNKATAIYYQETT